MAYISEATMRVVNSIVGRDVSQEGGSCRDYVEVYNYHINELREIPSVNAVSYIRFLLGEGSDLGNAMSFWSHVVDHGGDVNLWLENYYDAKWSGKPLAR